RQPSRRMNQAKLLNVGHQPAHTGPGGRTGCLIGVTDQDYARLPAVTGHGEVHEPVLHPPDHLEIAQYRDQARESGSQRLRRPFAERPYPRVAMVAESEKIGSHAPGSGEKAQIVDAVRYPFAIIGDCSVIEPSRSCGDQIEPEGKRLARMDRLPLNAERATQNITHARSQDDQPCGYGSPFKQHDFLACGTCAQISYAADNEIHVARQLRPHCLNESAVGKTEM